MARVKQEVELIWSSVSQCQRETEHWLLPDFYLQHVRDISDVFVLFEVEELCQRART